MKKLNPLLLPILFLSLFCRAEIAVIGVTKLNNVKLTNTQITIKEKESGKIIQSFSTKSKSDFMVEVPFGKVYQVYFHNPKSPVMFLEIYGDAVPKEKHDYTMDFHMGDVSFYDRKDNDVDTSVFKDAFYKIIFDGNKRMIDDAEYNTAFAERIIKKSVAVKNEETSSSVFTGKILLSNDLPAANKKMYLIDKQGGVIKSTLTNRYGAFVFNNVIPEQIDLVRMELDDPGDLDAIYKVIDAKKNVVATLKPLNGNITWENRTTDFIDNDYTSNIGGKLILSSAKEKKFFAEKTVYLCNSYHTILRKTKTTPLGTFAFEDIKPDNTYYICIDKNEAGHDTKIDLLSKDDKYVATLDSLIAERWSVKFRSADMDKKYNDITIEDNEMKMGVRGTVYGDNINNPIGKLKIILLNDNYQPIDSVVTDNLGIFKFKYLPFLKRFFLSAENSDNSLDVFKNILIYSNDNSLIKIMTHQKGLKFTYKPLETEVSSLRDIEIDDPWLDLVSKPSEQKKSSEQKTEAPQTQEKHITENILFETAKWDITPQAKDILDKIVFVLKSNTALKIEIGAHTDSKGSELSNMTLSENRAKTVREYIVKSGVNAKRIISKGYGETKLVNNCGDNQPCSEAEHAQNRRIEFKILEE
ncbi:MAG: OmpA family protein [Bacteroidetes bacterium]|nr:OmpA family protein [Bacteroidota bacterium]